MSEWQDISTAPTTDGAMVLLYGADIGPIVAELAVDPLGKWSEWRETWMELTVEGVTHWMPLPEPPL